MECKILGFIGESFLVASVDTCIQFKEVVVAGLNHAACIKCTCHFPSIGFHGDICLAAEIAANNNMGSVVLDKFLESFVCRRIGTTQTIDCIVGRSLHHFFSCHDFRICAEFGCPSAHFDVSPGILIILLVLVRPFSVGIDFAGEVCLVKFSVKGEFK